MKSNSNVLASNIGRYIWAHKLIFVLQVDVVVVACAIIFPTCFQTVASMQTRLSSVQQKAMHFYSEIGSTVFNGADILASWFGASSRSVCLSILPAIVFSSRQRFFLPPVA